MSLQYKVCENCETEFKDSFKFCPCCGMKNREELIQRFEEFKKKYPDENKVPRPPHWSGWNLKPERIEFWLEIKNRIHERLNYKKENNNWVKEILYP